MADKGFTDWAFNSKHNKNDTPNFNTGRNSSTSPYYGRNTSPRDDTRGRQENRSFRSTTPEYDKFATDRNSNYRDYDRPRYDTPHQRDYNRPNSNRTVNETRSRGKPRYHKQPSTNKPRSRSQSIDSVSPFHNHKFMKSSSGQKRAKTGETSLVKSESHRNFKNFIHLVDVALSEHKIRSLEYKANQRCPFQEANSKLQNIFIFGKQTPKSVEEDMNMYTKINDKLNPKVDDTKIWLGANNIKDPYTKSDILTTTIFPEFIDKYLACATEIDEKTGKITKNLNPINISKIIKSSSTNLAHFLKQYYSEMSTEKDFLERKLFIEKVYWRLREKYLRINEKAMFSVYQNRFPDPKINEISSRAKYIEQQRNKKFDKNHGQIDGGKVFYSMCYLRGLARFYQVFKELTGKAGGYFKKVGKLRQASYTEMLYTKIPDVEVLLNTVGSTSTGDGSKTRTFSLEDGSPIVTNKMANLTSNDRLSTSNAK